MIALKSKAQKGDEKKTYDTKMAAKVRFSGGLHSHRICSKKFAFKSVA